MVGVTFKRKKKPDLPKCPTPNRQVVQYLLASYLYYEEDFSIMADSEYDQLCVDLDKNFDEVTHWSKYLVDRGTLKAGSGFNLHGGMPGALIGMAIHWKNTVAR